MSSDRIGQSVSQSARAAGKCLGPNGTRFLARLIKLGTLGHQSNKTWLAAQTRQPNSIDGVAHALLASLSLGTKGAEKFYRHIAIMMIKLSLINLMRLAAAKSAYVEELISSRLASLPASCF